MDLWARLVSTHPNYPNFDVFDNEVVFGRRDDADIRIADPAVSSTHCRIWRDVKENEDEEEDPTHPHHRDVWIEDLSTNGTFIKEQKIGKGNSVKVVTGSEIVLIPRGKNRQKVSYLMYIPSEEKLEKAPEGEVTFVFTDVQGSTTLWENEPDAMNDALKKHDRILRRLLREFKGYEVKTEGDAFMVAFFNPIEAIRWCMACQLQLLKASWPLPLLELPAAAREKGGNGQDVFSGIRIRMGIHTGEPNCRRNPVTGRMDYFGPDVNKCARVSDSAHGGQVVMTQEVKDRLDKYLASDEAQQNPLDPSVAVLDVGAHPFKGISDVVQVYQIYPLVLSARTFPALRTEKGSGRKEHYHKLIDEEKAAYHESVPDGILDGADDGIELVNPAVCACPDCSNVETLSRTFGACASCKTVKYCGVACQRKHWKAHRKECQLMKQRTQEAANQALQNLPTIRTVD